MKKMLRANEHQIGEGDRQRCFGQPIVAGPGNELQKNPPGHYAQHGPAEEGDGELRRAADDVGLASGDDHAEQHHEHHDRRGVVQEGFALDEPGQTRRGADIAEDRDDGGRVGRRHDRAEKKADHQRQAGDRP